MSEKKQTARLNKGTSSAILLSILIHAALFLLAGVLVVFTVVKQRETEFEPPQAVERPKMKLKKPRVKIKKSSRPKATARIVTKASRAAMPSLELPEMSGLGGDLGDGGLGGFDLMPELDEISMFGGSQSIGNDLEGVIYDFKRRRDGKPLTIALGPNDTSSFREFVEEYIRSGWNPGAIAQFYRSPKKLYTTTVMVPPTESAFGPWAFGEREMHPYQYMIHYQGQLVHPTDIKFRFVVMGDNFLLIRLNKKVVMDYKNQFEFAIKGPPFKALNYHLGHWFAYASDWIELRAGVPQDLEIILGEYAGGLFGAMIAVEEYGVEYPHAPAPQDNPVLPIFKTAKLTPDQTDIIHEYMWEGHLDYENGPTFSDYDTSGALPDEAAEEIPAVGDPPASQDDSVAEAESRQRSWTMQDGTSIEAEYVAFIGTKVSLKNKRGRLIKVPIADFSKEDVGFLELLNPPELSIEFKKHTTRFKVLSNPYSSMPIPAAQEFAGGTVIRQKDMKDYPHQLRVEMYVIGNAYDGDHYILLDRQIETFELTPENSRHFELVGRTGMLRRYEFYGGLVRGEKYRGHMILVYDELGNIIEHNTTHDWLLNIVDKLRTFPVSRHFNKAGDRVHPPSPPFTDRFWVHAP